MKNYILFFLITLCVIAFVVIATKQFGLAKRRSESQAAFAAAAAAGATLITETAVWTTPEGIRVPFANVVANPDLTGMLSPENESPITIRKGDLISINSQSYRIFDLWLDENGHGHVALIKIE